MRPKIGYNDITTNKQLKAAYRAAHSRARELRLQGIPESRIPHMLNWYFGEAMSDCVMASYTERVTT